METFSIVFREEVAGPCVVCDEEVGYGPVGWSGEGGGLCDACLTECHRPLGMVLVMANLVRELGERETADADEDLHLMAILMAMARMYAKSASKVWPRRPLDFLKEFQAFLAQRPDLGVSDA